MARKTQEEINYWFQDNTIKSALDLSLIEKVLHNNNLDIPNNVIIHKNGSTYDDFAHWYCDETKISKYPTTYVGCCEVIGISRYDVEIDLPHPYQQKMFNLFKLHICRDAYWKIAGEEMGLDKPWEPDWEKYKCNYEAQKYCIFVVNNKIELGFVFNENKILAFPIKEMRDTFYENFKELIESCKTLL